MLIMNTFNTKSVVKFTTIVVTLFFLSVSGSILYRQQISQNSIHGKTDELATADEKNINEEKINIESLHEKQGFPVYLKIPSIGVATNIQHVGFNSKGEMDVPDNIDTLGWFAFGPRPGENGSAVIAGHYFGENGKPGVFANLSKVKEGDKIYVEDSKGNSLSFIVRKQHLYDPGFALAVFNRIDKPYLNLVTCDGSWDKTQESYTKRLVVFADIDNQYGK